MTDTENDATTPTDTPAKKRKILGFLISFVLVASTISYQGYQAFIAFDPDDTNHLETPLLLATARQLTDGPSRLYGPFSETHPLVLMHAPLYYRLSALIALPMARSGIDPVRSTMIAGRGLACVGLLLLLFASWRIARNEDSGGYAGLWAALLIASSPVIGSAGFTIRPDTLAIAFQTMGFGLVVRGLQFGRSGSSLRWLLAGTCFGLTFCMKQHLVVSALAAILLVILGVIRSRVSVWSLLLLLVSAMAVPLAYYSWEEHATAGMMSRSVFVLPSRLRKTAGATPWHVVLVFIEVAKRSVGELLLALAVLIGARKAILGNRIDGALWFVFLAETGSLVPLCLGSTGAWSNYAMPAVVWGSILLSRMMSRAMIHPGVGWKVGMLLVAAFGLLGNDTRLSYQTYIMRQEDGRFLAQILADPVYRKTPRNDVYFEGMPQWNRLYGRSSLAYDDWMFKAYEGLGMVEPRSVWLRDILTGRVPSESVHVVVAPSDRAEDEQIRGIPDPLSSLGYRVHQQYGPFAIWVRDEIPRTP